VPGHESIAGNKTANFVARTEFEYPFTGPEPACDILIGVAQRTGRDWMNRNHTKQWESTT
jgi:hypothetical protein